MDQFIEAAANYFVFTMVGMCVVLGMILRSVTSIVATASRERSRREIAAYIAEGSLTAEQGERLMKAEIDSVANRPA
jgi:hypothetical protein